MLASEMHLRVQYGLLKDTFYATNDNLISVLQARGVMASSITQSIILGFTGIMASLIEQHTMFYDPSMTGYGTSYGYSYGD